MNARKLRKTLTEAEARLWFSLRRKQVGGFRFRRQMPLGPYVVDFICLSERLVIGVDGGQHATNAAKDARRTAWLEAEGFRVIRFWNSDVLRDTETVVAVIRNELLKPR